jgi:hypothetical protein
MNDEMQFNDSRWRRYGSRVLGSCKAQPYDDQAVNGRLGMEGEGDLEAVPTSSTGTSRVALDKIL